MAGRGEKGTAASERCYDYQNGCLVRKNLTQHPTTSLPKEFLYTTLMRLVNAAPKGCTTPTYVKEFGREKRKGRVICDLPIVVLMVGSLHNFSVP